MLPYMKALADQLHPERQLPPIRGGQYRGESSCSAMPTASGIAMARNIAQASTRTRSKNPNPQSGTNNWYDQSGYDRRQLQQLF